ncbi:hypothetical protein SZ64_09125 [Erythrobacter sp. SG61-1L]|uniref:FliM/FliN family flagellar motor C-terminal domain-containing protein n=1 Tax=Erythrobacter sp. SG61-1L TaxID=1603897 RepID=UPI0006C90F59|nr:FliM/FliN family flagellar motor C-terminal domain-containing protein [Erythrobacter sp. SG61-1L]KPL68268.1 hypothetical protein SZ64_09125 [Erythrobacter sp. SG61-1L]
MSGTPTLWLPESALLDARTAGQAVRCIQEWAGEWCASAQPDLPPRWEQIEPGALGFAAAYRGRGFRLTLRQDGRLALASLLLGRNLSAGDLRTAQDRAVIDYLLDKAMGALGAKLDTALPDAREAEGDCFGLPVLSASGETLMRIEAGRGLLAALALGWAGSPRRRPPLPARRPALAPQGLRLSARLGTSRLSLPQIEALEAGDVLTLDTALSAPLDALIDDVSAATGALGLIASESGIQFQLTRPATQW